MSKGINSMAAIARLAGVARPTVSDILNDHWRAKRISSRLAARVQRIAAQHHYRPNRLVHSLRSGRTHTIAVMLPVMQYFASILDGVEEAARSHGYHIFVSRVIRGLEDEVGEIEVLLERRVDGLILVPRYGKHNRANYRALIRQGVPLVCVDSYFTDVPCTDVIGADVQGGYLATRHLLDLGHRRIVHLAGDPAWGSTARLRAEGYKKAMREAGVNLTSEHILPAEPAAIERLLVQRQRPTAVFAWQDYTALDFIHAAERQGMRVPQDVSVVGYSDCIPHIEFHRVPLTSVRVDTAQMGRLAMQHLLAAIGGARNGFRLIELPPRLMIRSSTESARGGREDGKTDDPDLPESREQTTDRRRGKAGRRVAAENGRKQPLTIRRKR